jgi:hypothetical protein
MRRAALGRLTGLLVLTLLLTVPFPTAAQFLRWTDDRGNAHYTQGLDNVPERYRDTVEPLGLTNRPPEPGPRGGLGPARGETLLHFTPGQHIVVKVRINGTTTANMILDTGAGSTLIHPRALRAAGVPLDKGRPTFTQGVVAGAREQTVRVVVDSLELGEARVGQMWVTAYDMGWGDEVGLLGQDFLRHFNVTIDPGRGVVRIGPR